MSQRIFHFEIYFPKSINLQLPHPNALYGILRAIPNTIYVVLRSSAEILTYGKIIADSDHQSRVLAQILLSPDALLRFPLILLYQRIFQLLLKLLGQSDDDFHG
jgi:hypothetical protein